MVYQGDNEQSRGKHETFFCVGGRVAEGLQDCFSAGSGTWTYNAQVVLLKNSSRSGPQGHNADYTSK
jgi:hypothetical protein